MRTFLFLLIISIITNACEQRQAEKTPSKLPQVYEELIFASLDTTELDSNLIKATLDKLQLSEPEFDSIFRQAHENPALWITTLDSIVKKLKTKRELALPN